MPPVTDDGDDGDDKDDRDDGDDKDDRDDGDDKDDKDDGDNTWAARRSTDWQLRGGGAFLSRHHANILWRRACTACWQYYFSIPRTWAKSGRSLNF